MKTDFIAGNRVILRTISIADLKGPYVGWFNDEAVCRYNSHHVFPYHEKQAKRYIERVVSSRDELVLAIVTKRSRAHIGNISLQKLDPVGRSAEFAIIVGDKKYWGKGYASEAARLIIAHGFEQMNLNRIYCGTSAWNVPMQRLALSMGMKREGRRRQAIFKHGRYADMLEYGLLRREYGRRTKT
jgi:RimJ/RimL family protein N-acetyltransferase